MHLRITYVHQLCTGAATITLLLSECDIMHTHCMLLIQRFQTTCRFLGSLECKGVTPLCMWMVHSDADISSSSSTKISRYGLRLWASLDPFAGTIPTKRILPKVADLSWKVEGSQHDRPHGVCHFVVIKMQGRDPAISTKYSWKRVGLFPSRAIMNVSHFITLLLLEMALNYLS